MTRGMMEQEKERHGTIVRNQIIREGREKHQEARNQVGKEAQVGQ